MAAVVSSRLRTAKPSVATGRRSAGTWAIIGVPVLLMLLAVWQVGSGLVHTEIAVRDAVAISKVSLEPDAVGSRIDLVLVDRTGQDTTVNGALNVKLREPDGTVWQVTRSVSAGGFAALNNPRPLNS